ncbi:hypothetical protein DSO57_1013350 [Entomophthora muscae]|uniref:Uncharacterized protein n=1 Tax=Entomophthora muscae TaxID=34485 RepID=A0ACC2USD6_9FUNG|nr:hypothetical protein DSO57_1013350 [Entomophthora muscae]
MDDAKDNSSIIRLSVFMEVVNVVSVSIDNSFPLEAQAQGRDSNPDPEFLQATSPKDQGATCLRFLGLSSRIIAPNKGTINIPNGGNKISTISFMSLKATPVANQDSPPGEGTGLQPNPMTTALKQDNQLVNSRSLTSERAPSLGAIFLPLNPSTQIPQDHFSQFLDESPMENVKFEGGVLYRPKDPAL